MVHVLANDAINQKIPQQQWQSICDTIVTGFKTHQPFEGLTKGLKDIGDLLEEQFPASRDNANEIPNKLNLID